MKTKILIIEDNLEVRENTAELLELANYEVDTAENGKLGVEKVKAFQPDLIICDIMMPELDGYGVLYMLSKNQETASIPFIFLSAKSEKVDFRKGMNLGADDYLTKPFEEMELLDAIETRLKKRTSLIHMKQSPSTQLSLKSLSEDRKERIYKKKSDIYYENDVPVNMFFVKSGKVRTYRINEDGKEFTTGLYGAGEMFGYMPFLNGLDHKESAQTIENSTLSIIPKDDFLSLLFSNNDNSKELIKLLANNVVDKEKELIDLAYNTVRKRVASALVRLADKFESEGKEDITITITRDALASIVGTATESVIRMLSEFKEDHYISIAGSKITILNYKALATLVY